MSGPRWERLQELFHEALPLDADDRASLLERACGDDPALRTEVERLLASHDQAGGFIHEPAIARPDSWPPETESVAGRRVGAYRLVKALGRGGMGAVYLAERDDGAFAQKVAIKLIKRGMDTDQVLARFRAERQILASLDHPNIARLLDGGTTDDGLPYFAMEYIDGKAIDAFAKANSLSVEDRLRLFLQVCDAVSYAHARSVIHRDIKPLNTLVTDSGLPKLLDFGIAKVLQDTPDQITSTVTGLRLLTPEYASPEQIEGRHATVASDVYSLGVVLYELLAGRSPYRLTSRAPQDVAAVVCTTEPNRPSAVAHAENTAAARELSRQLRGDLDMIVLTALRKEPARRYGTAADMADDIRRHLEGRPVLAHGDNLMYRVGKFARRNRTGILTVALAVVTAALLAAAGLMITSGDGDRSVSLLASRALAPRDRVLVADFADLTGDTTLTAAVTEAFRIDLGQSSVVRVMTPRQVRTSLELMQRSPDLALDDSLAREVALREGVKAFVTGSLARLSVAYTVNVQLVAATSGEALAAVRETAADSSQLILAVDRASKTLRRRIGESLRDLGHTPSLDQATTASLAALRLYSEGQRLARQGQRTEAIDRFEKAIALDTGFASAHVALGMAYGAIADAGRAAAAQDHAAANHARLPFLERSFLVASRAHGAGDYQTAILTYRDVLDRYPDNVPAMNNQALALRSSRQFAEAESLFRLGSQTDSSIPNLLFGLHTTQILQAKFPEASATLATISRRFPDNPVLLTEELQDAAAQQDWLRAERVAQTQVAKVGTDTLQLVDPYEALAGIAMTRGRLEEAERLWAVQLRLSRAAETMGRHRFGILQLAWLELRYRNDTARAVAIMDSSLRALPPDSLLPSDRRYDELARFYIAAGHVRRARQLLEAATASDSLARTPLSERAWTLGLLAHAEGRGAEALQSLGRAANTLYCTICALPDLGRAYEAAGRLRDAARTYEQYLTTPWLWRYEPDAVELGWTARRLAEVARELGDKAQSRKAYGQLVELWRDADPALGSILETARQGMRD